jgi:hypothetical protein
MENLGSVDVSFTVATEPGAILRSNAVRERNVNSP